MCVGLMLVTFGGRREEGLHESGCHKKFAFASCLGDDEEVTCSASALSRARAGPPSC